MTAKKKLKAKVKKLKAKVKKLEGQGGPRGGEDRALADQGAAERRQDRLAGGTGRQA